MLTSSVVNKYDKTDLTVSAAVDTWNDDWLTTDKDLIVDMNGDEVRLTGVNWFGFNCSENVFHGAWSFGTTDADGNGHADAGVHDQLKGIVDHGFNLLRVPISSELLVSWMNGAPHAVGSIAVAAPDGYNDVGCNAEFVVPGTADEPKSSMEIFDIIMGWCKELGLKVMIDIHSPDENNSGHNYELWYGKAGITSKLWEDSLVWLADKYSNDDTIIAYDLKNEPHGKAADTLSGKGAKWDSSTDEFNWKYAAEKCGNAIMEVNPNALIMIEGIEVYPKEGQTWSSPVGGYGAPENYYGAWWGGNLRGVREHPITITGASGNSQVVYSPHDYGPTVYAQTWFHMAPESPNADGEYDAKAGVFTEQSLLDEYWYDSWAYIDAEHIAPLLIGEWGLKTVAEGGTLADQKWGEILRDYMTKNHINATFWCYNPDSGDTGGLVDNDWSTWVTAKYELVEPSLWQDDSGKFIGLDHEVALGANGQSLNEYYGNTGGGTTTTTKPITTTTKPPSTTTTKITTAGGGANYGDINGDGIAGKMDDIVLFAKYFKGNIKLNAEAIENAQCDKTGDSATKIDSADLTSLINYLLGQVTNLPIQ
ncbi:MAG: cellulase family glycosylhydrolase [Oscillospiraceae bacterium]|nr:cellulase family glycosylhydrolase [Oscillospiraceae bacterium]